MQVLVKRPRDIGQAMRQKRETMGLQQQEVATMAGVSLRQVSRLELNGGKVDPKLSTIRAVARVLNITFVLEPETREVASGE